MGSAIISTLPDGPFCAPLSGSQVVRRGFKRQAMDQMPGIMMSHGDMAEPSTAQVLEFR